MRVLLACEESQAVCIEFRNRGHEAYSCDILPCSGNHPEWHIQDDVFNVINWDGYQEGPYVEPFWDMMVAFPPCTYLTISANKWYKDQPPRKSGALVGRERRNAREEAKEFFMKLWNCDIPRIAIENPIGIMSTEFRKPDQIIQPWMFGHGETKATCLWLKNLPPLVPTEIVEGRDQRLHRLTPSPDRAMIRSKTFPGIARAMAATWG